MSADEISNTLWRFDLGRHDESGEGAGGAGDGGEGAEGGEGTEAERMLAAAVAEGTEPAGDGGEGEEGGDLGEGGKRALQRERAARAKAAKEAADAKRLAAQLQEKVKEFEDRDKSELERTTSRLEEAQKRAEAATARAVRAEVRAAAAEFADPEDASAFLDLSRYVDASGDIDSDAIQADLAELLDRKPHLRRAAPAPEQQRRAPRPDPGQGGRPGASPTDFRTAPKDQVAAELAKYAYRQRS